MPILQEYDASHSCSARPLHPAEFGNLAARHNLVEIAEACRREADGFTMEPAAVNATFTVEVLAKNPASVQLVEIVDARLLARPVHLSYLPAVVARPRCPSRGAFAVAVRHPARTRPNRMMRMRRLRAEPALRGTGGSGKRAVAPPVGTQTLSPLVLKDPCTTRALPQRGHCSTSVIVSP